MRTIEIEENVSCELHVLLRRVMEIAGMTEKMTLMGESGVQGKKQQLSHGKIGIVLVYLERTLSPKEILKENQ